MSFLKIVYLIVMPLGIILLMSCLLKIKLLVKFSYSFCRKQIGDTPIRIVTVILILNFMLFITESYKLRYGVNQIRNPNDLMPSISSEYFKIYKWRHERNWWIGLSNLCIWLMLWRSTGIINHYIRYLDQRKKQMKLL
ncbi:hypothetical protein MKS88_005857 [Plasmodium brasilianum]|uniref:BAP29/BAP31 transmembrane domain-containing protein n=2 Tax=Plasmodium (Plasmodium) TaxID=418103 RepID=A0A1D3TFU0_PLAMA|nr:conserved Plasmodium protein, unknown function [Plasmodium malariae]KAI4835170.1 hypothetical protein MKS88_005857 [Plasmodium brasilianum]SCP03754.1 conserved Plasmodium protein, unknown function [Plasmodium malariae]